MLPGDRLVCAFVEPLEAGSRFAVWPLHLTIVPWFRLALNSNDVLTGLQTTTRGVHPFMVVMAGDAHFGRRGRKLVSLVALPSPVTSAEQAVRTFLKSHGAWLVDETTEQRQPYRPHVTVQGGKRLHRGDEFLCGRLCLVEQLGNAKTVVGIVEFA
jgi:2'-5' RNA ligase